MTPSAPPVTSEFNFLRDLMLRETSIVMDTSQEYLLPGRLTPLVRSEGFNDLAALVRHLQTTPSSPLRSKVIDALTTNETLWFRDTSLYSALRTKVVPQIVQQRERQRSIDIWCGACATGQEPYTLAMFLDREFPELNGWRISIIATDISEGALKTARAGIYNQMEIGRGLPAPYLVQYFERTGMGWQLTEGIRNFVSFRSMNLAGQWPVLPRFDLIFIRNVLIYFDKATTSRIMANTAKVMKPDSFLILGASEKMPANPVGYRQVRDGTTSWYQLP